MTDTRAARLARIDDAIAGHRQLYLTAVFAENHKEARQQTREVDRLLDLRNRVQRGWPRTALAP